MVESAKSLVDDVARGHPIRQWVLILPIPLRLLLARYPKHLSKVMQIIHRAISTKIVHRVGVSKESGYHRCSDLHTELMKEKNQAR